MINLRSYYHPLQILLEELGFVFFRLNNGAAIEIPKNKTQLFLTTSIIKSINLSQFSNFEKNQIVNAIDNSKLYNFKDKETTTVSFPTIGYNTFLPTKSKKLIIRGHHKK